MQVMRVQGGARLVGEVPVVGAKNSVLKLMAASLLAPGRTTLHNLPDISDVGIMTQLLERLGCTVVGSRGDDGSDTVVIDVPEDLADEAPYELVRQIRGSIAVLGPLVARCEVARVALPGGDAIGSRPIDMHIAGLRKMGADVDIEHGFVVARAGQLHGASIYLDFPSVGATENIVTAAVLASGTTVLDNAAREPEIVDLCRLLVAMGAHIDGIGTSELTVEGVDRLHGVEHVAVPDRIVAGTWALAAMATRGDVRVTGADAAHLRLLLDKIDGAGGIVQLYDRAAGGGFRVQMPDRPRAFDVVTLPYPGLASDLQPQAIAMLSVADGVAMITENLFEARFMFCDEIARMGADVRTDGHHAVVRGRSTLSGAPVTASDIRAGVGLVIAGLVADGVTEVSGVHHIDRGYVRLDEQLRALGADVERVEV